MDHRKSNLIIGWERNKLRVLIGILSGYGILRKHAKRLGITQNDLCRYCEDIEVARDIAHVLCKCPDIAQKTTVSTLINNGCFSWSIYANGLNSMGKFNVLRRTRFFLVNEMPAISGSGAA